jgi:D-tyrosyl-tRNA(Tyr) deacylase
MKLVIQRVSKSSVSVSGQVVGSIGKGLCVLIGIAPTDTEKDLDYMASKLVNLRIFEDEVGKMNLSLLDIGGSALIISQFTLLADCIKGRRPSFTGAGNPTTAEQLYLLFLKKVADLGVPVEKGIFGAEMQVSIENQGPATFILETPNK